MTKYCLATLSSSKPKKVEVMPIASENGWAFLSVKCPTSGCNSDAVNWNASVISPICAKSSA